MMLMRPAGLPAICCRISARFVSVISFSPERTFKYGIRYRFPLPTFCHNLCLSSVTGPILREAEQGTKDARQGPPCRLPPTPIPTTWDTTSCRGRGGGDEQGGPSRVPCCLDMHP